MDIKEMQGWSAVIAKHQRKMMRKKEKKMNKNDIQKALDEMPVPFISICLDSDYLKKHEETIRKALQQAQEIAEGKAHVMRWLQADDGHKFDLDSNCLSHEDGVTRIDSVLDTTEDCGFIATFNGDSEIPIPKEID